MIWRVTRRRPLDMVRDGRLPAALLAAVIGASWIAGWTHVRNGRAQRAEAAAVQCDQPVTHLARGAPGFQHHVGVSLFLDAPRRNLDALEPADDAPTFERCGDLIVALTLPQLMPLCIIALTFASFAGARAHALRRHVLENGVPTRAALAGTIPRDAPVRSGLARMRRLTLVAALALTMLTAGCGPPSSSVPPAQSTSPAASPATPPPATPSAAPEAPGAKGDAHHEHEAPHGGNLVEFGEEFAHLELVLDGSTGRLTTYALDGEAEQPARLAQPSIALDITIANAPSPIAVTLQPVENALTGEKAGDTSQFSATVSHLKGRSAFSGVVTALTIRGRTFSRVPFTYPAEDH